MKPTRIFTAHPASVGESYFGHLLTAVSFGLRMIFAGIACVLHGLFPFLCVTTGSDQVRDLHAEMAARCERARAAGTQRSESEIANTSRVGA
jgi:acetyl esterase/lipase